MEMSSPLGKMKSGIKRKFDVAFLSGEREASGGSDDVTKRPKEQEKTNEKLSLMNSSK